MNKLIYIILLLFIACNQKKTSNLVSKEMTAEKILGNVEYQAICYGGYRTQTREKQPTIAEIKEDLKLLAALNFKIIRTLSGK